MTTRLEYLFGMGSLLVAGLTMTALYLRAKRRRDEAESKQRQNTGTSIEIN